MALACVAETKARMSGRRFDRPEEPPGATDGLETAGADSNRPAARPSSLDIGEDEMRRLSEQTIALATEYFARVPELDIFSEEAAEEIARSVGRS
jgi:hypothetical protein